MYNTITTFGFQNAGPCPSSHPVRVPQVVYETVWDTTKFSSLWTESQGNPFVWSFEGTRGYGTHADYMFGWKGDALQRAMNKSECFYDGCGSITKQDMSVANKCTVKDMVGENIDGCEYWLGFTRMLTDEFRGRSSSGNDELSEGGMLRALLCCKHKHSTDRLCSAYSFRWRD